MSTEEKHLEIKVGLFVLIGLGIAGFMFVRFGNLGEGFRTYDDITVEFANAAGLLKDSDVLYGGARIGYVAERPRISNDLEVLEGSEGAIASTGVIVELKIFSDVDIPADSRIMIGSSGLLGDRFVDVIPPGHFDLNKTLSNGDVIAGTREAGIDDITREGTELLQQLRETVTTIDSAITRVDETLLAEKNLQDIEVTLSNLRETTDTLKEFGTKINLFVDDARAVAGDVRGVVAQASEAVGKAEGTLNSTQAAAAELELTISEARAVVAAAHKVMDESLEGDGLLAKILMDEKLSTDVTGLISNLRRHGVLFYRNSATDGDEAEITIRQESSPGSPSNPRARHSRPVR